MIYHVLPGDAQVEEFRKTGIEGELIVFREAFITGPIDEVNVDEFWDARARFILSEYGEDVIDYHEKVADELLRLDDVEPGDEVSLWFEFELFCSVNMWFCLAQLNHSGSSVYRVAPVNPSPDNVWDGFGRYTAGDLQASFDSRVELSVEDIETGAKLWAAYRDRDTVLLRELGNYRSPAFPFLKEVCEAAAEIEIRPAEIVREIMATGKRGIEEIFPEFKQRAGVYGFGDLQVEKLIERFS
jgi:hypothetical protein